VEPGADCETYSAPSFESQLTDIKDMCEAVPITFPAIKAEIQVS
jgi:hypothetical protein